MSEEYSRYLAMGKEKLRSAAKATKESSLYNKVQSKLVGANHTDLAVGVVPNNAAISFYATYCRQLSDHEYVTDIAGVISAPGAATGRNKMMLRMARRMARGSVPESTATQFEDELTDAVENPNTGVSELDDEASLSSSTMNDPTVDHSADNTVDERMAGVIAQTIASTPLEIIVGADTETSNVVMTQAYSDEYGMFQTTISTAYRPSGVQVVAANNPEVMGVIAADPIPIDGFAVISDVDDTVRNTGVLGEKIELFRNIFAKPYTECEVEGLAKWYQLLNQEFHCPVHYVSNSPYQVYNIVSGFLDSENMPVNSIACKQYFGNILSSVTQASSERKRPSILKILNDFPNRRHFLIGDSGEKDFEAYTSLAPQYADQILAIYIRAIPGSFSMHGRDKENVVLLQQMLDNRPTAPALPEREVAVPVATVQPAATVPLPEKKLAPIVPSKPDRLRGDKVQSNSADAELPPPLPKRQPHHLAWLNSTPSSDNVALSTSKAAPAMRSSSQLEDAIDSKLSNWKERVELAIDRVPQQIPIKFWWTPEDVMEDSFELLKVLSTE